MGGGLVVDTRLAAVRRRFVLDRAFRPAAGDLLWRGAPAPIGILRVRCCCSLLGSVRVSTPLWNSALTSSDFTEYGI